jgi:hypothetical protein
LKPIDLIGPPVFELQPVTDCGDRLLETADRVHAHLRVGVPIDHQQAVVGIEQRVAVARGAGDDLGRDDAVGAGPVVDHDVLAERRSGATDGHVVASANVTGLTPPPPPRREGSGGLSFQQGLAKHESDSTPSTSNLQR